MRTTRNLLFYRGRLRLTHIKIVGALALMFGAAVQIGMAQQPAVGAATPAQTPAISHVGENPSRTGSNDRYRIGPGDLLDIRALNQPRFSRDAVRVDSRGMITVPYIGEIQAACRTEKELAREISTRYQDYLNNPEVDIFVKEYQSQTVAVIGAVTQPGRFQVQRPVRLLELLTFAGGPVIERAGRSIQIIHAPAPLSCQTPASNEAEQAAATSVYYLRETLRGDDASNPYLRPGDIVTIPEAEQIYVVGNVVRPSPILLREPITVSRAIAMAGGTMRDTKSDRVRIIRQVPGSTTKNEIYVDLKAIEKRRAEDTLLQANDIVDVPESGARSFVRSLMGTITPTVAQLPVRVIP